MTTRWYDTKPAYTIMKLDCMLQRIEAVGWCDIQELHEFVLLFKTMPLNHQMRYAHLLDEAAEYWDEGVQPCE